MRAAATSSFGPPETLRLNEVAEPLVGTGQVRVQVRVAGVQPVDCKVRAGATPFARSVTFPLIPGNEFAGVVDSVGEGVTEFSAGDEVLGFGLFGCYAEYVVVPADQIVSRPPSMPWEVAGGFPGNGQGAHMALREMRVCPGDTVLINAAAGALGTFAVQLARAWGAEKVIGTASEANHDYLRALGAVPVTYGEGLAQRIRALVPEGVDAALDAAGEEALRASVEVTKDKGRVVTMVSFAAAQELGLRDWSATRSAARLTELVKLYEEGALTLHIRAAYPLERAAEAHRDVGSGHGRGKVVITVG
ncbi:NADP-dependent oxidoreductase [Streptomyces sp. NBC_01775]|uniref:NADP-dependent oxidoreductase n=1 Tax=Streptomyces sp. NBC_01775 TaxID=2975939 RepID=UPI002DDBDD22|nr:NADP-dependent oxidoreductase [Streptomyces sp. NBC_01775]WSB76215.1 NADP-dependent oxidoreductase [Streptomyces sp. NBC_01775]